MEPPPSDDLFLKTLRLRRGTWRSVLSVASGSVGWAEAPIMMIAAVGNAASVEASAEITRAEKEAETSHCFWEKSQAANFTATAR